MAASFRNMSKQTLEKTTMHVHRVRQIQTVTSLRITVEFSFLKLTYNKAYKAVVGPGDWDLQVVRCRQYTTLKLCIRADSAGTDKEISCCVMYDDLKSSDWVKADKTSRDTYVISLPTRMISNPENAFLTSGRGLVCVLKESTGVKLPNSCLHAGARSFQEAGQLSSCDGLDKSDESVLIDDLVDKSARAAFTDFEVLNNDGTVIPAHRSVLAVRSGFFRNLLRGNGEMEAATVDVSGDLMLMLINFMYYGHLYFPTPQLVYSLLSPCKTLELRSLDRLCMDFVKCYVENYLSPGIY